MKKQKRKIILIIILIILCLIFFQNKKNPKREFQDELIFFKLFSSEQETKENKKYQQYKFKLDYENIDYKDIKLTDTIKKDTLVQEKIAPGTKGNFEILLETNEKIYYQIKFESKSEKPKNLKFRINEEIEEYEKLEDMQHKLQGEIKENKSITINWEWKYEENEIQDKQDTKDGQTIGKYIFTIYAIGKQLY